MHDDPSVAARGETFTLTEAQVERDRAWWEANVYRTLHRLASADGTFQFEITRVDARASVPEGFHHNVLTRRTSGA